MDRIAHIVGKRYGRLLVLGQANTGEQPGENGSLNPFSQYRCRCDCGRELITSYYAISRGKTSCGCDRIPERNNLRGWRFGRLVVLRPVMRDAQGRALRGDDPFLKWECRCDCGNHITVYGLRLVASAERSCGCDEVREDEEPPTDVMSGCTMSVVGKRNMKIRVRARFGRFEYDLGDYPSREQAEAVRERAAGLLNMGPEASAVQRDAI